ncbi:hypothetical protein FB451DRAFT_1399608 [Mycena latifolia]|nr:hypothetical protein FB451DRAFT_1399608 [Mycena latifolia]
MFVFGRLVVHVVDLASIINPPPPPPPTLAFFCSRTSTDSHGSAPARPYRQNKPRLANKLTAAFRYNGAQQVHLRTTNCPAAHHHQCSGKLPFIIALMIAVSPLYWPSAEMGNNPPIIANRVGWISIAIGSS